MDFHEKTSVSLFLDSLSLIENITSAFHHILLYKHNKLGKVLIIDNEIMHIENYECFYHEPLVHLPFALNHTIKSVLILGGGSLFAAREALKYPLIENVVLCDHDKEVLNLMRRHYGHVSVILNDHRFHYVEKDALLFLKNNVTKFDLIINDCFDMSTIYVNDRNLYEIVDEHLSENGLCSDMVYNDIFDHNTMSKSLKFLKLKPTIYYSLMYVPEYPGILHMHAIWGKKSNCPKAVRVNPTQIKMHKNGEFQIFNPNYLNYYFYLPKLIRDIIE